MAQALPVEFLGRPLLLPLFFCGLFDRTDENCLSETEILVLS
jgi:hypothetical protein